MKYVKIYDSKGQCQGVADIEQNYDKAGYAKLLDSNMHVIGFVDVDNIPESGENMPFVQVFDENMQPCGVVTADNIRHSDGYLITLQKNPSTTGTVTGGGRFIAGTSVTVVATPDAQSQYPEFDGWYEGATKVSENASYTFTVSGARTLVAKFKEVMPAITELTVNGTSILDESSSISVSVKKPTLHVKVQRHSLNHVVQIVFSNGISYPKDSTFKMPSGAYTWEGDITSQDELPNGTYSVELIANPFYAYQVCGSIKVNV